MKALSIIILISGLVLGFPQTACADYEDGDVVPASVVAPLMAWVEAQVGVRVPVLPDVVASRSRLTEIVGRMGRIAGRAKALYIGGTVILDHRYFDPEDETQVSLLVHELVHYAQAYKRSVAWTCAQAKEVEAYTIQNKWLEDQGHSPFVNASWISRASACPATTSAVAMAAAD